jgi:hypothetical protein
MTDGPSAESEVGETADGSNYRDQDATDSDSAGGSSYSEDPQGHPLHGDRIDPDGIIEDAEEKGGARRSSVGFVAADAGFGGLAHPTERAPHDFGDSTGEAWLYQVSEAFVARCDEFSSSHRLRSRCSAASSAFSIFFRVFRPTAPLTMQRRASRASGRPRSENSGARSGLR